MRVRSVRIVSLSSGILGEPFVEHELNLGLCRLKEYGLRVTFAKHALSGIETLKNHPEFRAQDLLEAFSDENADLILCAIGGDDTYRLAPYLFEDGKLQKVLSDKLFLGFSDTTVNHFMLHKLGLKTFYGQAFLSDVAELDEKMLPYTRHYFEELLSNGTISRVSASDVWYSERTAFDESQIGVPLSCHFNSGFDLAQGSPVFTGTILGGCLESMYDMLDGTRYPEMPEVCARYGLFPSMEEWKDKILLLETSEEKPAPEHFLHMLKTLKKTGIFDAVNGVLLGKPQNNLYYAEYRELLLQEMDRQDLPIVCNINVGHALPRCIIPFGVFATVDANQNTIVFEE